MQRWIHGWLDRWFDRWVDGERDSNWRLKFKPGGWDVSLQDQIQACKLRFKPGGLDPSLQTQAEASMLWSAYVSQRDRNRQGPLGILFVFKRMYRVCSNEVAQIQAWRFRFKRGSWDSSRQAQIQAWRLRFKPGGWSTSMAWAPPKIPSQDSQNIRFISFICFICLLKVLLFFCSRE